MVGLMRRARVCGSGAVVLFLLIVTGAPTARGGLQVQYPLQKVGTGPDTGTQEEEE